METFHLLSSNFSDASWERRLSLESWLKMFYFGWAFLLDSDNTNVSRAADRCAFLNNMHCNCCVFTDLQSCIGRFVSWYISRWYIRWYVRWHVRRYIRWHISWYISWKTLLVVSPVEQIRTDSKQRWRLEEKPAAARVEESHGSHDW